MTDKCNKRLPINHWPAGRPHQWSNAASCDSHADFCQSGWYLEFVRLIWKEIAWHFELMHAAKNSEASQMSDFALTVQGFSRMLFYSSKWQNVKHLLAVKLLWISESKSMQQTPFSLNRLKSLWIALGWSNSKVEVLYEVLLDSSRFIHVSRWQTSSSIFTDIFQFPGNPLKLLWRSFWGYSSAYSRVMPESGANELRLFQRNFIWLKALEFNFSQISFGRYWIGTGCYWADWNKKTPILNHLLNDAKGLIKSQNYFRPLNKRKSIAVWKWLQTWFWHSQQLI